MARRRDAEEVVRLGRVDRAVAEHDAVGDLRRVDARRLHRRVVHHLVVEVRPVEVELAVLEHVHLVEVAALVQLDPAVDEDAVVDAELVDAPPVDERAHDAQALVLAARELALDEVVVVAVVLAVERLAVGRSRLQVGARDDRRGVRELDVRDALVPADVHVHRAAHGLAGRVLAVAVEVVERHDHVRALLDVARLRLAEVEVELVGLELRHDRVVRDAQHRLGHAERAAGRVRRDDREVRERAHVERELARHQVDAADALARAADVAVLAALVLRDRDGRRILERRPGEVAALQLDVVRSEHPERAHVVLVGAAVEARRIGGRVLGAERREVVDLERVGVVAVDLRVLDLERARIDVARRERAADGPLGPRAEVDGVRRRLARLDVEGRVRHDVRRARERLDHERRERVRVLVAALAAALRAALLAARTRERLRAVVAQRQLQRRDRHVLDLRVAHDVRGVVRDDARREVVVARLREVAPAVLVGVLLAVPRQAARERGAPAVLEQVVHHVVVGEELAGVDAADREEVVRLRTARAVRVERIELRAHVERDGEEELDVVAESVAVGIIQRAVLLDVVELLPPVGDEIAVGVDAGLVGRVELRDAVHRHDALVDVDLVGRRRGHLAPVVRDLRVPAQVVARVVALRLRVGLPPVRQAVGVLVGARVLPQVGRRAVPHLRAALRVRAAERDELARAEELAAHLELRAQQHELAGLRLLHEAEDLVEVDHPLEVVGPALVRQRRVRERELAQVERLRQRVGAAQVLAVVERVDRRAVERRQARDRVRDPRHDRAVPVHRALLEAVVPPADRERVVGRLAFRPALELEEVRVQARGRRLAARVAEVRLAERHLREADRRLRDVRGVHRARQRREVVVQHQLRRERRPAVVVVARALVRPRTEDLVAVVGDRLAVHVPVVVRRDLLLGARAVPDADLVDVALEELADVRERLVVDAVDDVARRQGDRGLLLRTRADEERDRGRLVARDREGVRRRPGDVLQDARHAVGRDERRRRVAVAVSVHEELQHLAVVREREVRPLVERQRREAVEALAAHRRVLARLDRVAVVEEAVRAAVLGEADAEVRADRQAVLVVRVGRVGRRALEDRLRDARALGHDPALDRELLEEVRRLDRANVLVARHRVGVDAVEVQGLAARRVVVAHRVGDLAHALDDLVPVGREVVVRVVALALLERVEVREVVAAHRGRRGVVVTRDRRDERQAQERGRRDVVLAGVGGRRRALGEPPRRRVGVARHRVGEVRDHALVLVAHAVAVRIGARAAHRPRIEHRVERLAAREARAARRAVGRVLARGRILADAARRLQADAAGVAVVVRVRPLVPERVVGQAAVAHRDDEVRRRDDVAALAHRQLHRLRRLVARRAEDRVEAVEHLVVVVHAVAVGIGHARVGRDEARVRRHDADDRVLVERASDLERRERAVPLALRRGEVAVLAPAGVVPGLLVRVLRRRARRDERLVLPDLGRARREAGRVGRVERHEAEELLRVRRQQLARHGVVAALGEEAAHERGRHVVVAEVADGLHQVLLVVLQAVVVEVDVALRADHGVVRGAAVARRRVRRRVARPGRVHAAHDVHALGRRRHERVGDDRADRELKLRPGIVRAARRDRLPRREAHRQTRVREFPRVRQAVLVGVDRARVHAAAAHAARDRVLRLAVDEALGAEDRLALVEERTRPGAALHRVADAVKVGVRAVGVAEGRRPRARMGREELVEPALDVARMVLVDRRAVRVGVARIGAGVLQHVRQAVAVVVALLRQAAAVLEVVRPRVRAARHVELPAVRHAVLVGVRAVRRHRRAFAAGLREGVRERLGDRRARRAPGFRVVRGLFAVVGRRGLLAVFSLRHLRVGDGRVGRLRPERVPRLVGVEARLLARVHDAVVVAVAHHEVFVERVVRTRVDRRAGRVERVEVAVDLRIPAVGDVAPLGHVPARARVVAEPLAHLVVDDAELEAARQLRALGDRDRRRCDVVDHVHHPVERIVVAERTRAVHEGLAVHVLRMRAEGAHGEVAQRDEREHVVVDARLERVDDGDEARVLRIGIRVAVGMHPDEVVHDHVHRHEVAVLVGDARGRQRILAHHDLPAVAHAVAVGIPVAGVRADGELLEVGESVAVEVGMVGEVLRIDRFARVEALLDLVKRNLGAREDVADVEALEHEGLALARTSVALGVGRHPDVRLVPEEVLPAVREAVPVGVLERRVHARVLRAARLRAPLGEVDGRGLEALARRGLVGLLLVVAEVRVGERDVLRVEAAVEAADLRAGRQRNADGRVAVAAVVDERDHAVLLEDARQVVLVRVGGREVGEVRINILLHAGDERDELAALPRPDRERVRHAVLVDVAEVVGREPLLREDGLDERVDVAAVLGLLGRQHDLALADDAQALRRDRVAEHGARHAALLALRVQEPAVEEGVLLLAALAVGERIVVVRPGERRGPGLVDRLVHAVERAVVVRVGDLVAEAVDVHVDLLRAVPAQAEVLRAREDRAVDERVAHADAVRERVLLRQGRGRRAARGAVRERVQELRGRDRVEVGPRLLALVLVGDRQRDRLIALHRAEVRREGVGARLVGSDEELHRVVVRGQRRGELARLAAGDRHLDAREVRNALQVVLDVVLDRELDRTARRETARDDPGVRARLGHVGRLRRDVVDVDLLRVGLEVVLPRRARLERVGLVHDLGLEREALRRAEERAVHLLDEQALRRTRREGDVVFVVGQRRIARRHRLVLVGELEDARVVALGRRDRQLDDHRLARIREVAQAHLDVLPELVFEERVASVLAVDRDLRLVDDVDREREHVGGVLVLALVAQVLVLQLDLDRVEARDREVVLDEALVDACAVGNRLVGARRPVGRVLVADRARRDLLAAARDRVLVLEAVLEVEVDVVDVRRDLLRLSLRVLVLERLAVGDRNAVDERRLAARGDEDRLLVVDGDGDAVRRRIARHLLVRIPDLRLAEDDAELVGRAAARLARAVLQHEVARRRRAVGVDAHALARRDRRGHVGLADDRLRARAAERAEGRVVVVHEERVDDLARRVAHRDLVVHALALDVVRLRVGRLGRRALRRRDRELERRERARELADRRGHLDGHGVFAALERRGDVERGLDGIVILADEREVLARGDERRLLRLVGAVEGERDRVARLRVAHVRVRVVDLDVERIVLARGRRLENRLRRRERDERRVRVDVDARRVAQALDARGLHLRGVDVQRELDLLAHADRERLLGAERVDVDVLLLFLVLLEHDRRNRGRRKRLDRVVDRREAQILAPVRLRRIDLEARHHRHGDVVRRGLRRVDRQARHRREIRLVGRRRRDDGRVVALDHDAHRQRRDALHGHGDVVGVALARFVGIGVVAPRAQDETRHAVARRAAVLGDALDLEVRARLPAGDRDLAHGELLGVRGIGAHLQRPLRAALDLHGRLVVGPDVELDRVLDRGGRFKRGDLPDRHRGLFVHRAPELRALLRGLPRRVEVDRLDVEAALREREVLDALAVRRRHRLRRRVAEPQVARVAVVVDDLPLQRTRRVEVVLVGRHATDHLVRVGRRVQLALVVGRREHDRQRVVARLRPVGEDEVGEARRRIGPVLDEVREGALARDVDADLHRGERERDLLVEDALRLETPDRRRRGAALHEAYVEVDRLARRERRGDRRVRIARDAFRRTRTDLVDVAVGRGVGEARRGQARRERDALEDVALAHGLISPSAEVPGFPRRRSSSSAGSPARWTPPGSSQTFSPRP